jgi:hypothetical protein
MFFGFTPAIASDVTPEILDGYGLARVTATTTDYAGRISVDIQAPIDFPDSATDILYNVSIYSDEAKTITAWSATQPAGQFFSIELNEGATYWVDVKLAYQDPTNSAWVLANQVASASAVSGVASHDAPTVEVTTSRQAASIHIKLTPAPQDAEAQFYHIQISESSNFSGMAWTHTTTEREFDLAIIANRTYYVREAAAERIGDTNQYFRVGAWGSGSATAQIEGDEARLSSLTLEEGVDLNTAFSSDVLEYTATVKTTEEALKVSASAILWYGQVSIQGNEVSADSPTVEIPLSYGENLIGIKSVSPDSTKTVTYLLTVTRAYPQGWTERTTTEVTTPVETKTETTETKPAAETVIGDPVVDPTVRNISTTFTNILESVTGDLSDVESEVQVSGLQPDSAFTVKMYSDPILLFEGSADANGDVKVDLDWTKADCTPGEHRFEIAFVDGDGLQQYSNIHAAIDEGCTVGQIALNESEQNTGGTEEPEVTAQPTTEPTVDYSGWIIGGIALVVLAGAGVVVARRRRV